MRRFLSFVLFAVVLVLAGAQQAGDITAEVRSLLDQCDAHTRAINVELAQRCAQQAITKLQAAGMTHDPLYAEALLGYAQVIADHDSIVAMMHICHEVVKEMTDIDKSLDYDLRMARQLGTMMDATETDIKEGLGILAEAANVMAVLEEHGHPELGEKYKLALLLYAHELTFKAGMYDAAQEYLDQAVEAGARPETAGATYADCRMWQLLLGYQLSLYDAQHNHRDDLDDLCKAYFFMLTQDVCYQFPTVDQSNFTGYALTMGSNFNFLHQLCIEYRDHPSLNELAYNAALFSRMITRRMDFWHQLYTDIPDSLHREMTLAYLLRQANQWETVQRDLQPGEAAIEFVTGYSIVKGNYTTQHDHAAIVLRNDRKPVIVPLADEPTLIEKLSQSPSPSVPYQLLWKPLEAALEGIHRIYYTPAGIIAKISLNAFKMDDGRCLGDCYDLQLLSTTGSGSIPALKQWKQPRSALLMGDISYGSDIFPPGDGTRGSIAPLDNSRAEINAIHDKLKTRHVKCKTIMGTHADEQAIKQLTGHCPELLHISAHGFYIGSHSKVYNNPMNVLGVSQIHESTAMRRCGLLLAGANRAWTTGQSESGQDDGILTAEEIAALDLSGCRMVVLSACETGLGDATDYEGVLGLQRAFKLAGVQTIVMSLWRVRDEVTALLMTRFYEHLLGDKVTPHEAMRRAQRNVRSDFPDPKDWAAFVVLDG